MPALRLLGPLELSVDGRERALGGARQQVVLAMLALNANRITPVEHLIDAVWNAAPPTTARAQIQICVSGLRRVLADAGDRVRIETRTPGYLLEIPENDLDTAQFTGLVGAARTHLDADRLSDAVATLRSALRLWRGPALAGLPSEALRRRAAQLEDTRLSAMLERIRIDLALGHHEDVIGELFTLVRDHPLRERLYELLMLALYRSGRQAEALEVCRCARATLMDELGIELSQSVRRLETAILTRDPELDLYSTGQGVERRGARVTRAPAAPAPAPAPDRAAVPRHLPPSIADFTGRLPQLAEIRQVLGDEHGDEPRYGMRIVAICGKGGVGKSTLALRAAHELRDAYPDGHLYADLTCSSGGDRVRELLAKQLRALGVAGNAIPDDTEERADLYRTTMADKRMLVVLDGATNEDDVVPLLPAGPGCAVLVTSRAPLSGLPGARLLPMDVFDVEHGREMLARIVGAERLRDEHAAVAELISLCGGLPLALRIAGARLASRPHWRVDTLVARLRSSVHRLDELSFRGLALRSNIALSYRMLSPTARCLFRRFSLVAATDFPAWTAAALLEVSPTDTAEVIERLVEAQLLDTVEYPGGRLRYRFHDLIRIYAEERLTEEESEADRLASVVRLLGAWLARVEHAHVREYGDDTVLHGTAPRWERAPELEEVDPMGDQIDWLDAERRSLVSAVHLAAEHGLSEACWDLALTATTLFELKGHFDEWGDSTGRALAATEASGNRRGRAAMLYSLGTLCLVQTTLGDAERYFRSALDLFEDLDDEHGSALVLRDWATVDRLLDRGTGMVAKYHAALERMRRTGDLTGEAHILRNLAKCRIDDGDAEGAREMLDDALHRFRRTGHLRGEAQTLNRFVELYLLTGEDEQAHRAVNRVLWIVRDLGDRIGEAHALYQSGVVHQRTGRLDNAETTLRHALALARDTGQRMVAGQAHHALGTLELARGRLSPSRDHAEAALDLFTELGSTVWQAKALILRSTPRHDLDDDRCSPDLDRARALLDTVRSGEAARLRAELVHDRRVSTP